MPFTFYAETSFTVMCGCGYLIFLRPLPSTAVQYQASVDGRYPVLSAAMSEMYSVSSVMDQKTSVKGMSDVLRVIQIRLIEWLVDSKIETENKRSLSTCS